MVKDGAVVHDVLEYTVVCSLCMFYTDDGLLGYRDPEWLQSALNILIELSRQIGLAANVYKSKTITCRLVAIILGML